MFGWLNVFCVLLRSKLRMRVWRGLGLLLSSESLLVTDAALSLAFLLEARATSAISRSSAVSLASSCCFANALPPVASRAEMMASFPTRCSLFRARRRTGLFGASVSIAGAGGASGDCGARRGR